MDGYNHVPSDELHNRNQLTKPLFRLKEYVFALAVNRDEEYAADAAWLQRQ
ncbi:hypothetical protein D3C81_1467560 [compost metagenome]